MRKKLYLVALFCGALCLTGCLKNEESASVTQVRFAKANELNSLAALNNAKAQAATIAAEADAAYKAAQAKVAEAEAKLKEADAAYREAETQLKLVEVALQEVKVQIELVKLDEEKVELDKKRAELEKLQEQLNVVKAQAAADIAMWVAQLEDIQRDAEISAAQDALALLQAQQAIVDYAANLEKTQAADITAAANNYFTALNTVTTLNTQLINASVTLAKADYNKNAAIQQKQENIADLQLDVEAKKAALEELKKLATMTEEEVEAAEEAAEAALIAALEVYRAAQDVEKGAKDAMDDEFALKSKFYNAAEHNWSDFTSMLDIAVYDLTSVYPFPQWETVEGFADKYAQYGFNEPNDDPLADPVFVPLYNYETILENVDVVYPDPSIYGTALTFPVTKKKVVPATINYDKIKHLEELSLNKVKDEVDKAINDPETGLKAVSAKNVEEWNDDIAEKTHDLDLHKEYVNNRKEAVEKAEKDLDTALKAYNESKTGHEDAIQAYQEYMVKKYDVSRIYFETVWKAAKDTVETSEAYWNAKAEYDAKVEAEKTLNTDQTNAYDAMKTAETTYGSAKTAWDTEEPKIDAQKAIWNPDFAYEVKADKKYYGNGKDGSSQYYWMVANNDVVDAEATRDAKKAEWDADPTSEPKQNAYWIAYGKWSAAVDELNDKTTAMNKEEQNYKDIVKACDEAKKALDEAKAAWNPDGTSGTTQVAYVEAWGKWHAVWVQVNEDKDGEGNDTAKAIYNAAEAAHTPKVTAYETAWGILCTQLGFDPATYEGDATAEDLWKKAEIAAKDWSTVTDEFNKLWALYVQAPDAPYTGKVGWLISNYEIDPYAEYVWKLDNTGEIAKVVKRPIAFNFGYTVYDVTLAKEVVDPSKSLDTKIKDLEKKVADEPEALDKAIANEEKKITEREKLIADFEAKIAVYKQYEADYTAWVASREATVKAYNDAKLATFNAKADYKIAAAEYEADHGDFFNKIKVDANGDPIMIGGEYQLEKVNVQEAIKNAETAIETAEDAVATAQHSLWEMEMDYEAWVINQTQDLAVLQARIDVYAAIAEYYKAILDSLMESAGIAIEEEEVPAE